MDFLEKKLRQVARPLICDLSIHPVFRESKVSGDSGDCLLQGSGQGIGSHKNSPAAFLLGPGHNVNVFRSSLNQAQQIQRRSTHDNDRVAAARRLKELAHCEQEFLDALASKRFHTRWFYNENLVLSSLSLLKV